MLERRNEKRTQYTRLSIALLGFLILNCFEYGFGPFTQFRIIRSSKPHLMFTSGETGNHFGNILWRFAIGKFSAELVFIIKSMTFHRTGVRLHQVCTEFAQSVMVHNVYLGNNFDRNRSVE